MRIILSHHLCKMFIYSVLLLAMVPVSSVALIEREVIVPDKNPEVTPPIINPPTKDPNPDGPDPVIHFPDPIFKSKVNEFLSKSTEDMIRQSDIDQACPVSDSLQRAMHINNTGTTKIKSIEGIQALKQCNINNFILKDQEIIDLTPLSDLISLVTLSLEDNQIETLDPLANLINLKVLLIDNNKVSNLMPLKNLTLIHLTAAHNNITDINALNHTASMQRLSLNNNQITTLSVVSELPNLQSLEVRNNKITDIEPLKTATNLRNLDLGNNPIADLLPLKNLTMLQLLNISHISLLDDTGLAPISQLPELKSLSLDGNSIKSLTSLMNITQLIALDLSDNDLQDLTHLADYKSLQWLDVSLNQIDDLSDLSGLLYLSYFAASNNNITNLEPIQHIKLAKAVLNNNKIDVTSDSNKPAIVYWQGLGATIDLADQDISPSTPTVPTTPETTKPDSSKPTSQSPGDGTTPAKSPFVDTLGHWAENDIIWAFENKMVSGTAPGIFAPNKTITEVEFLKILLIAMNALSEVPPSTPWYQKYVDLGLEYHYPIHPDKPTERISRNAVAEVIAATQGKSLKGDEAIQYLLDNKLSAGKTAATVEGYKGLDFLTRAEAVRFIRNVLSEAEFSTAQPLSN